MSLYDNEKLRNPRRFKIDVTANINECETCVIRPYKHLKDYNKEHCSGCTGNKEKEVKTNLNFNSNPINVIFV